MKLTISFLFLSILNLKTSHSNYSLLTTQIEWSGESKLGCWINLLFAGRLYSTATSVAAFCIDKSAAKLCTHKTPSKSGGCGKNRLNVTKPRFYRRGSPFILNSVYLLVCSSGFSRNFRPKGYRAAPRTTHAMGDWGNGWTNH